MPGPYNIPVVSYSGTSPDPVEWANEHIKPAIDDLDVRVAAAGGGGGPEPGHTYALIPPSLSGENTVTMQGANWIFAFPIHIPGITVSEVSFENLDNNPAATIIVGLYSYTVKGGNGTLLHDFGTVDMSGTAGVKTLTGNWVIPAGKYYLAYLNTGDGVRVWSGGDHEGSIAKFPLDINQYRLGGKWMIGSSGTLPATLVLANPGNPGVSMIPVTYIKVV